MTVKSGPRATTAICSFDADNVLIRGKNLVDDLIRTGGGLRFFGSDDGENFDRLSGWQLVDRKHLTAACALTQQIGE